MLIKNRFSICSQFLLTSIAVNAIFSPDGAQANLDTAGLVLFNGQDSRPNINAQVSSSLNPTPILPFNHNQEIEVGEAPFFVLTSQFDFRKPQIVSTFNYAKLRVDAFGKVLFGISEHGITKIGELASAIEISKRIYDYYNGNWIN